VPDSKNVTLSSLKREGGGSYLGYTVYIFFTPNLADGSETCESYSVIPCHTLSYSVSPVYSVILCQTQSHTVTLYILYQNLSHSVILCHTLSHSVAAYDVALAGSQTESTNVLFFLGSGPDDDTNNLRATGVDSLLKCYRLCLMMNSGNCLIFR